MSEPYLYEFLIRGNATGEITGAHQIRAVDITNPLTQETTTHLGVAEPIDPSQADDVLNAAFAGLANDIVALRAEHGALCGQHEAAQAEKTRLDAVLSSTRDELGQTQASLKSTAGQLASAQERITQLEAALAAERDAKAAAASDLQAAQAALAEVTADRERLATQVSAATERETAHGEMEAAPRQAVADVAAVTQERDALAARIAELQPNAEPAAA